MLYLSLRWPISYASECTRNNVKLLEDIIELQNNEKLMTRINAVGQSYVEIDNSVAVSAIESDYWVILEGFSKYEYYSKISHDMFRDVNGYPKVDRLSN